MYVVATCWIANGWPLIDRDGEGRVNKKNEIDRRVKEKYR